MTWIAAIALAQPSPEVPAPVAPPADVPAEAAPPVEAAADVPPQVEAPPAPPPVWLERPAIRQEDYPPTALQTRQSGTATLQCAATPEGVPTGCTVVSEEPPDYGFGYAAIQVVERSRLNPDYIATIEPPASFRFRIPFALSVSEPLIIVPGDQLGAATLRCRLSEAGAAAGCIATSESPPDQGFGQQAVTFLESTPLPTGLIPATAPGQEFTIQIRFGATQP